MPSEIRDMLAAKAKDAVNVITQHLGDADPRIALKAAELLLDRAYGKALPASRDISLFLSPSVAAANIVESHGRLVEATGNGEIGVDEARDMSAMFENHRRLVETGEILKRLDALEASQGGKQ